MNGFGPSTGRLVEVGESSENRLRMNTRPMPPVVGILAFVAAFLGFIFGWTLIYENEETLGLILFIGAVTLSVLSAIWAIKTRR